MIRQLLQSPLFSSVPSQKTVQFFSQSEIRGTLGSRSANTRLKLLYQRRAYRRVQLFKTRCWYIDLNGVEFLNKSLTCIIRNGRDGCVGGTGKFELEAPDNGVSTYTCYSAVASVSSASGLPTPRPQTNWTINQAAMMFRYRITVLAV